MKILRLRLRDFKGVADSEVTFAPDGVTIVEGPNEVGKTSLGEGLTLVLEHLDSSSRAEIRDAKPVHRDAGPWVEAELTTGGYHLIIEKRWLRSPMTHLRVLAPRAEEMTGREAHERLRAILDETLDQQLFSALHYLQGVDISQAAVGESLSLAAALDASASGQSPSVQADAGIVDRVRQERARYFTPGGKATADRSQRTATLAGLRQDADTVAARIRGLDELAERFRSLSGARTRLDDERTTAERLLAAETRAWQGVQEARRAVAEAGHRHDSARAAATEAERRLLARADLRRAETDAAVRTAASASRVDALRPGADAAEAALTDATTAREAARAARAVASSALRGAREDHEYARRLVSRDLWAERLARVRSGQQTLATTAELIGANRLDAERLTLLEAAASTVTAARARLSAASAGVGVTALRDVTITIGDDARHIDAGGVLEAQVDGTLVIGIGDLARITVTGGAPERSLRDAVDAAEHEFRSLLVDSGLPAQASIAECRIAAQARRDALAQQAEARRLIGESLRDLTVERLEQEVADDEEYLRAYVARHGMPDPTPEVEATKARLDRAEIAAAAAGTADDDASRAYDAANAHRGEIQRTLTETQTAHHVAVALHRSATDALELARGDRDDDALERAVVEARQAERVAADTLATATAALAGLDPDSVDARRTNLEERAGRVTVEANLLQQELVATRTELVIRGDEGLHDRHEDLEARWSQLSAEHDRVERAAAAIELLWERLEARRDAAQRSYVAPYRAEIERLGRIVYGPSFGVDIDHATLTIASRTLNDRTVAFGQLSSGAREQLCVLSLLACAGIVAVDGRDGVPVIIDDALGWTDRDRLERLGAAFAAAGRNAQVIVLTCDPARYRTVGSATVRRLQPERSMPAEVDA